MTNASGPYVQTHASLECFHMHVCLHEVGRPSHLLLSWGLEGLGLQSVGQRLNLSPNECELRSLMSVTSCACRVPLQVEASGSVIAERHVVLRNAGCTTKISVRRPCNATAGRCSVPHPGTQGQGLVLPCSSYTVV